MGAIFASLLGASWVTSVIGILAGISGYLAMLGPNLPTDLKGWGVALFAGLLVALGVKTKASNVSNAPNPAIAAIVTETPAAAAKAVPTRTITK